MERELLLLGLLRREDMHGYQLHEFINKHLSTCTTLKKSTAYYLLDKMAEKGWLESSSEQAGNRPQRQVYTITDAGETAFQKLLRENLITHHPTQFIGDIGLTFIYELPPEEALTHLKARRDMLAYSLEDLTAIPEHGGGIQLVIRHYKHHLHAELEWLDSLIGQWSGNASLEAS